MHFMEMTLDLTVVCILYAAAIASISTSTSNGNFRAEMHALAGLGVGSTGNRRSGQPL